MKRLAFIAIGLMFAAGTGLRAQFPMRLNNLVTELLRVETVHASQGASYRFQNPRSGWVFLSLRADARDGERVELNHDGGTWLEITPRQGPIVETMRLLPEGTHEVRVRATGVKTCGPLIIRAMPETHFVRYPQEPHFPELGKFSWDWLKKNVLSSVNTVAGAAGPNINAEIDEWTRSGRKFISYGSLPHDKDLTGPRAFEYWHNNVGFQDPRLAGLLADEFSGRQKPLYPAWIEGMKMLGDKMKGSGKAFYAYTGGPGMHSRPESRELVRTVIASDFYMAWERYHHEMPTEEQGRQYMDRILGGEIVKWRAAFPGLLRHLVMVLGIFMSGPELNVQPDVNYKVWMDMQMQYLATHPQFDGLFGVHWWYSGGATEEILRWESALYRHYCINGATGLLSTRYGWTYALDHIANPDFLDELKGWTAEPAAPDSLKTGYLERYACAQGRYWQRGMEPDEPSGNAYLWMRRQAGRPNKVSQKVRKLVPGRLYSVEMITADYQDIRNGRSVKQQHAVSLEIEGAQKVEQGSYRSIPVSSSYSHAQLPFKNGPAWFNHHRLMFRATQPEARLIISDWAKEKAPGGPAGQELMFNYVQLEPYFERTGE
ncbi:MAG: hypothetical protein LLG20_23055 [Acidobacteriales bacterium]|nr:hypothetical protein [Terriglobales bacterium]